jgi:hypothetical protein
MTVRREELSGAHQSQTTVFFFKFMIVLSLTVCLVLKVAFFHFSFKFFKKNC